MSTTKLKVIEARKAIRQKLRLLRLGHLQQDQALRETFKPVTESVERLSHTHGKNEDDEFTIQDLFRRHSDNEIDRTFGVGRDEPYMLGAHPVSLTKNVIRVGEREFERTPGLVNLIFLKTPDPDKYLPKDLKTYGEILRLTNAHKKNGRIKNTNSKKYKNIIKHVLSDSTGAGIDSQHKRMSNRRQEYIYYDDPNEIIERLRLLTASSAAGNTSHTNEIISIISELRERRIIE